MWQSLAFGPNYKAAYCMAVCPAGEDVIGPWLNDKKQHLTQIVRPLQEKAETVYVVADSDAEKHVAARFPRKHTKRVDNGLRPRSIAVFLRSLPHVFQRGKAEGLDAVYHFRFTGAETADVTVCIHDQTLQVSPGLSGSCDLQVTADSDAWLGFLAKERNLFWQLLTGRIGLRGNPLWLARFGRCFPA